MTKAFVYKLTIILVALTAGSGFHFNMRGLPISVYAPKSALAQGKWVKIKVSEPGMQFLSVQALKDMGFSDLDKVEVRGFGGEVLSENLTADTHDDLPLQPVVRTQDGIYFYGTGTVTVSKKGGNFVHYRNVYSTASYYFVGEGEGSPTVLPEVASPPKGEAVQVVPAMILHETETTAPGQTGADLLGEDFRSQTIRSFDFIMPDAADSHVEVTANFGAKTSAESMVSYLLDGTSIGSATLRAVTDASATHTTLRSASMSGSVKEPGNTTITVKFSGSGVIYSASLDYIRLTYNRLLKLSNAPVEFYYEAGALPVSLSIESPQADIIVWDITDTGNPLSIKGVWQDGKFMFSPADGLHRYVAFAPGMYTAQPVVSAVVPNQDLHSMEVPNLVIITPKELKPQAERVATMHRDQDGLKVALVTTDEIYNEFSSGAPDVTAYRRMLKMWWDKSQDLPASDRLQNCLLFGRTTYDHRQISDRLRTSQFPRVLTRQTTFDMSGEFASVTETNSYGTDNYIGMLDDCADFSIGKAKMNIGVGRMPVKNLTEARTATDKLLAFVTNPNLGAWKNNVLLLADDGDNAVHAEQTQSMYRNMTSSDGGGQDFQYERMYIDAYDYGVGSYKKNYPEAKSKMLKLLDEGVSLWTYIGHANPTSLTAEDMWNYTDLTTMANPNWPVFYTASCEFVRFDADAVSGAETMWLHPASGIIASVAANRKVFITNNGMLSNAFGDNYFKPDAEGLPRTLGEIYKDAVNQVGTDENKHRFAIMGDPAMRVPKPLYRITLDTIDDVMVSDQSDSSHYPVINGLSQVKISGSVLTPSGELAADFDGVVIPTLFDAETVVTTNGHVTDSKYPDGKQISYNDHKNKLFTGQFPVSGGKWEATLLIPEEIENNHTQGRITMYAHSTDGKDAHGSNNKFYIYGWNETAPADTVAPEIEYIYLDTSAFRPGATVGPDPVLKARLSDASGINISASGVGRLMTAVIDDNLVFDNLADYYTTDPGNPCSGLVAYPFSGLQTGPHTLEFLAWDNAGNCTRGKFNFNVADRSEIPDFDIFTDASPATTSVTFFINAPEAIQGRIEVFDLGGRRLWETEAADGDGAFSSKWNLHDKSGSRVPRGIYLYRATITDRNGAEKRATKKFTVSNP